MSVGPSALGTVLVQRLDAVLGTTMAAHANLVSGARPDAVAQPGEVARPGQTDGTGRQPRPPVDPAGARGPAVADAKTADTLPQAAQRLVTRSDTTASAPTTLGQTARTILALLALYPDQAPPAQGKAPLWPSPAPRGANPAAASGPPASGPPTSGPAASRSSASSPIAPGTAAGLASPLPTAAALAGALRQALQTSGLFYESHLGDLAFGQRTAEQLRGEPQAALARAPADIGQPDSRAAPATGAPSHREASASSGGHTPAPATAAPGAPAPAPAGIHADAAPLVRQQLDILANQALVWQGEAWPDAPMEWEVRRDAPEGRADAPAHWATRLTLDLPRLGLVEARLSLAGDQLVMQLTAPRSAREINGAAQALRAGLQRAGLALSHLSVGATAARPAETAP
ncbi:flagellar hook-length control protein FliK [Bordetella petrii]|nr:flagellar hook-length control protein FliK [Bordetella petrii]